jgi:hypothetical protein
MPDLRRWPARVRLRTLTAAALLATVTLFALFAAHDRGLSPYTIVSLELAWTPAHASALLAAWGAAGRQLARESLLLDFTFMPAYALLFAGLVLFEARRSGGAVQRLGLNLALAPFAAWLLDAAENLSLLAVLNAPDNPPAPLTLFAGLSATVKFLLLLACVLYIVFALAYRLAVRQVSRTH